MWSHAAKPSDELSSLKDEVSRLRSDFRIIQDAHQESRELPTDIAASNKFSRIHDAALAQKGAALVRKEAALVEKEAALAEKDAALDQRDAAAIGRDVALAVERDAALAAKDEALLERDAAVAQRDAALLEKDAALAQRDAALVEKDIALVEKDGAIRAKDAALAATNNELLKLREKYSDLVKKSQPSEENVDAREQIADVAKQDPMSERRANPLPNLSEQRKPAVTLSAFDEPFTSASKFPSQSANWPSSFSRPVSSFDRPSNQERQSSSLFQVKSAPTAPWNQKSDSNVKRHMDNQNVYRYAIKDDQIQRSAAPADLGGSASDESSSEDSEAAENYRPEKRVKLDVEDATAVKSHNKPVPMSNAELRRQASVRQSSGEIPSLPPAALDLLERMKANKANAQRLRDSNVEAKYLGSGDKA